MTNSIKGNMVSLISKSPFEFTMSASMPRITVMPSISRGHTTALENACSLVSKHIGL